MVGSGFTEGFLKSWGVILASEIGDKTFFIAAILAMRHARRTVFAGAIGALAAMTVLSAALGWAAPNLISKKWTHWGATLLFLFFGARMLYEAITNAHAGDNELEEVEKELQASPKSSKEGGGGQDGKVGRLHPVLSAARGMVSPVLLESFTLTFLAEWGDRSQIATIGLAAAADVFGVTVGGILGHAMCTGAAVLGGKHLAEHINERMVAYFGGTLFLIFGLHSIYSGVPERAGGDATDGGKSAAGAAAGAARDFNVLWHGRVILSLLCAAWALSLLLRVSSLWGANSFVLPAGVRAWTGAGWMCRIFLTAGLGVLHPLCACLTLLMLKAALSRRHRPEAMRHPTGRLVGLAALCALPVAAAQAAVAWLGLAVRYQGRPVEASPRSLLGYFFATYWQGTPQQCGTSSDAAASGGGGGTDGAADGGCTMCVFPAAAAIVHAVFAAVFLVALCVTCGRLAAAVLNQRLRRRLRAFQAAYSALTLLGVGAAGASVAWGPFTWANQACWLAFVATSLLTVLLVEWEVVVWPVRDLRAVDKRLLQWVDAFTVASAGEELDNRSSGASSFGGGGPLIKSHGRSADAEAYVAAAAAARTQSVTAAAQAPPPRLASSTRTLQTNARGGSSAAAEPGAAPAVPSVPQPPHLHLPGRCTLAAMAVDLEKGPQLGSSERDSESAHSAGCLPPADGAGLKKMKSVLSKAFLSSGMPVTFKDVTYTVVNSQNKKEKLDLLTNVGGYLLPGEMAALMGPSGSGKSTLLDLLSGRKTVGELQGKIAFAGNTPTPQFLRRFTGYVEQFDTLLGTLTVEEMLMYTAELKRPTSHSHAQKKKAVEELVELLALEGCRNVLIGSAMNKGISGGQAKRVNIGIALVTNPRVLFLDEPTSGLDSYTANEVMSVVKSLSTQGITVCATIHSPTPYTFNLFDRLLLLLRGNVVYFGPNGKLALEYFHTQCPSVPGLKEGENEAEWLVDLTTQADRQGRAADFAAAYAKSEFKTAAYAEIESQLNQASDLDEATRADLAVKRDTVTPFWWALRTLMKYRALKNFKSPDYLGPRVGDKLIFSLLIFTLFWKVGKDLSSGNLINISAVLFMWTTLPAFGAASYVPAIVLERPLFVRERNDGLYRVITYMVSKILEELIVALFNSIVFANIVFWALQLKGSFALFWLVYFVTLSTGIVLAYFIAALSPNMDVANAALPTYVVTLLFFAGFLLRFDDIPNYWKWYSYIDVLRYAWGALMANQFGGDRNVPFLNGETILEYYSLGGINMWGWLGIEACFTVVFFVFAYLALKYVRHVRR
ncbi:P-loop containing nucleoside triphosphate hydrolase isoform B [Micractinium conductrix]|uniref:P-loop containing nucleoside triphosphate hydrolase isoform B n=1 Tax=Micractinium conductrix TaxID=554055 RepID=A0A2P6VJW3_9CHLO|nr:P-loop containing nucleoside triphosphate hydrolase isoform B [Micractinium conductrix]|eukprot:PSC74385.1 P-loop containing nucleoside triphosphate hydrolase isoform B [Micractinium conductrix]